MEKFTVSELFGAFSMDGLTTSHPIYVPVESPDQINEIFDSIIYNKVCMFRLFPRITCIYSKACIFPQFQKIVQALALNYSNLG